MAKTKKEPTYTKRQIIESPKTQHPDVVAVVLEDDKRYTKAEINTAVSEFLKKKVK